MLKKTKVEDIRKLNSHNIIKYPQYVTLMYMAHECLEGIYNEIELQVTPRKCKRQKYGKRMCKGENKIEFFRRCSECFIL